MSKSFNPKPNVDVQPYQNHLTNINIFNIDKIYEYATKNQIPINFDEKKERSGETMNE